MMASSHARGICTRILCDNVHPKFFPLDFEQAGDSCVCDQLKLFIHHNQLELATVEDAEK